MMQKSILAPAFLIMLLAEIPLSANNAGTLSIKVDAFAGQDLHLAGQQAVTYQLRTGGYILVFRGEFQMSAGDSQFYSDQAVVWLEKAIAEIGSDSVYNTTVFLQGDVFVEQAGTASAVKISRFVIEQGRRIVVRFDISGEVLFKADEKETIDPRGLELYAQAFAALQAAGVESLSLEAEPLMGETQPEEPPGQTEPDKATEATSPVEVKESAYRYPISLSSPLGGSDPNLVWDMEADFVTVIGRFYLSQKLDERGGLLELQADNAVIFLPDEKAGPAAGGIDEILAGGVLKAIYMSGDVVMAEGLRTIRTDEIYYDFERKKAVANNTEFRTFDASAGIPIYVRAAKLQQLAENKFAADDATLTTSEFYVPQVSLNASYIEITDMTAADAQDGEPSRSSFDAQMRDVRLKFYDQTIFYLPFLRSNLQRPDVPLKSVHIGHDNTWGTFLETRWYLARLLGLQEPESTDSTLALDYYDQRGFGGGIETDYERDDYFGRILGYMIDDNGQDRLGRQRKDIEPPRELRGRFSWQHRQFLPYSWQLTTEVGYLSDEHFLESYYRNEYNLGKEQETLLYLKRIEDNWGLSILGKIRINNFVNQLEELPSAEFHWTGQSFFDDNLTFYSDTQVSRLRQRYASDSATTGSQQFFSFSSTRNEIDMPISMGRTKVVPFIAGTVAYENGLGFYRELDGQIADSEDEVWFGEAGVRLSSQTYWKIFPDVKSQLWDLDQLRHLIRPHLTAVGYTQSDSVIEQRDTLNVGISQRLQTKRGEGQNQRTVDWMRLDMDVTWVNNSDDTSAGADRFIWNKPFIPLLDESSTTIPQQDRRHSSIFGSRSNHIAVDYVWRISDTTALLSDMNYDLQSDVVQQFNVGFSRMRWPNLNYYIGSRYLRRIDNSYGEKGSNAFTFGLTYLLDPRYTLVYTGQFDFDYGSTVRNDFTIIRQYHRLFWSVTYSTDESLDRHSVAFSLWPQGVPDLAIGPSRYMELGGSAGF